MKAKAAVAANGGNLQHALEHGVDAATTAAHHTIDSVSDAAGPALSHIVSSAHGAVDRAGVAATHGAGTLGLKGDQLSDGGKQIAERAGSYLREHPLASLGMAVAAGYLLSRLLSPR
jgi:ElaB/YqjD/DUF883 family membrane-anchored ribosome-binding protein